MATDSDIRSLKILAAGFAYGALTMGAAVFSYAEQGPVSFIASMVQSGGLKPTDLVAALIGDQPVLANVKIGGDCRASVCTRKDTDVLVKGVLFEGPFARPGLLIGSAGSGAATITQEADHGR